MSEKNNTGQFVKGDTPWNKGVPMREEAKKKLSDAKKEQVPWNKGLTGCHIGDKNPMFGKHHSDESKRKMSDTKRGNKYMLGKHHSEETKKKIGEANREKHPSEETKQKMSESRKGENNPNYGKHISDEQKRKIRESEKGKKVSDETRQKISEASKKNWQNPDYIKKVFDGLNAKPNAQEKKVDAILQKHLSKQYMYNGDFSCGIVIGGKIPDFVNVNGEKVVIEVFGPWHDEQYMRERFGDDISWKRTEFGTKAHYSQFGYKCVVFWQEDLEREDVEAFVLHMLREEGIIK